MNSDKVALITGASSGIGRAVAEALGEDGFRLALVSRDTSRLQSFTKRFDAVLFEADLSHSSQVEKLLGDFHQGFDRVDLLFNSAGVLERGLYDLTDEDFDRMWTLNVRAPYLLMQGVLPKMESRQEGHIINVSSRSGKVGFPGAGVYSSTKFGLNALNEATYKGYAEKGIKVTSLCPSWVDTPMAQEASCPLPSEERIPTSDLVSTVRWLLSLSPVSCVKEVFLECRSDIY